jgi:hypothetical protein
VLCQLRLSHHCLAPRDCPACRGKKRSGESQATSSLLYPRILLPDLHPVTGVAFLSLFLLFLLFAIIVSRSRDVRGRPPICHLRLHPCLLSCKTRVTDRLCYLPRSEAVFTSTIFLKLSHCCHRKIHRVGGQNKARSRAKKTLPDPRLPLFSGPSFDRVRCRLPLSSVRGVVIIACAAAEYRSGDLLLRLQLARAQCRPPFDPLRVG